MQKFYDVLQNPPVHNDKTDKTYKVVMEGQTITGKETGASGNQVPDRMMGTDVVAKTDMNVMATESAKQEKKGRKAKDTWIKSV